VNEAMKLLPQPAYLFTCLTGMLVAAYVARKKLLSRKSQGAA
jgi:hypothetical protein